MKSRSAGSTSRHTVPVLLKAIRIIEAVAQRPEDSTNKGLALTLGISQTTCYRILHSYVDRGWLRLNRAGRYELSVGLVPVLRPLLRHEVLIEKVQDPLARLAASAGMTAKLSVPEEDDIVTIHSAQAPREHAVVSRIGSISSLAIGSSGPTVLASLPDKEVERILRSVVPETWKYQNRSDVWRRVREARQNGWCYDAGSFQPHINSMSSPLRGPERRLVGVITLLGFPSDFSAGARPGLGRLLKQAAGQCNQLLDN